MINEDLIALHRTLERMGKESTITIDRSFFCSAVELLMVVEEAMAARGLEVKR